MQWNAKIVVLGAGDRGTATAIRLFRAGLRPLLAESQNPADLHYFRNFSDLRYCEKKQIDETEGRYVGDTGVFTEEDIRHAFNERSIPLVSGSLFETLNALKPEMIIDCRENSEEEFNFWQEYSCVIRVGLNYNVGADGHVVVGDAEEAQGRVFYKRHDRTQAATRSEEKVEAPIEGVFVAEAEPGQHISFRQNIGRIDNINIMAPNDGYVAGILHSGHFIRPHQPLCEIQPAVRYNKHIREIPQVCLSISGGVLEAVLAYLKNASPAVW
jgi:biotin carboxyl carrier protein